MQIIDKSLAVNLDRFLGKTHKRHKPHKMYRIGIELEGGWETIPEGYELVRDASVVIKQPDLCTGECRSGPIEVEKFPKWLMACYPTTVNKTCGMHVHMSFKEAFRYARLMRPEFPGTILRYIEQWAKKEGLSQDHPLWNRLNGKSDCCQPIYWADLQVLAKSKDFDKARSGHRYTMVNFPYGRYKTVECRLLPMMQSPKQAIRAIQEVLNITNAFLVATAKRDAKVVVQVTDDTGDLVTYQREYV